MARTYLSRFLRIVRDLEEEMAALFAGLAASASRQLLRFADSDGQIPPGALFDVQTATGALVTGVFLARTADGQRMPFVELSDGTVRPLSPYARSVLEKVDEAEALAIQQQQTVANRFLRRDPAVQAVFRRQNQLFQPNPLAQYERAHTWVDPRGYRLSERIWRTSGQTRRKLDMFLEERISQGQGALDMSRDLERFLQPGRQLARTQAPYGTDASFDAMRLARTEISRAHAKAQEVAMQLNPFVEGVSVVLSMSHPREDICDEAAAASPFPVDDIPAQYQIPMHPQCMCHYRNELIEDPQSVLDSIRDDVRQTRRVPT